MARQIDPPQTGRITACIYGLTGSGKSTLSGHLPGDGRIILFGYDQNAPGLDSIASAERPRFRGSIFVPDGNAKESDAGELNTDWELEASRLFQKNWKAEFPDAQAIIVDAVSTLAYKLLYETAKEHPVEPGKKQLTTGETYVSGRPKPQDKESKITNPQLADYGLAQQQVRQLLEWLIVRNPELDIFCLFHEGVATPDPKEGLGLVFGPEIAGSKGPRLIPQLFNTVLWLEQERKHAEHKGKVRIQLRDRDNHIAHIKTPKYSEVPNEKWTSGDPAEIKEFWTWIKGLKS